MALIQSKVGINVEQITLTIDKSKRTVERHLKLARTANLSELTGARKAGAYYMTEKNKVSAKASVFVKVLPTRSQSHLVQHLITYLK